MNLKDILAVSGLPGLYKLVNTRNNGLFVANLNGGKTIFCTLRKHQFTPLETVAIYTDFDSIELKTIFERMMDQAEELPPADPKGSKEAVEDYFSEIVPDYDKDKVYLSDMKKVIKWYNLLDEKGYLAMDPEPEEAGETEE